MLHTSISSISTGGFLSYWSMRSFSMAVITKATIRKKIERPSMCQFMEFS